MKVVTAVWTTLLLLTFILNVSSNENKPLTFEYGRYQLTVFGEKLNFTNAREKCHSIGQSLALFKDLSWAYNKGFHSCIQGWLADYHTAHVQNGNFCPTNRSGVVYSPARRPFTKTNGAYCTDRKYFKPGPYNPDNKKVFNMWIKYRMAAAMQLREDLRRNLNDDVINNIRALYVCCNIYKIGTLKDKKGKNISTIIPRFSKEEMKEFQVSLRNYFPESQPKLVPHFQVSYSGFIEHGGGTVNRTEIIDDLVKQVVDYGWDGVMVNYEPTVEYTKEHANTVAKFLNILSKKLHQYKLEVGFCISDWGILKYWRIYHKTEVDYFATMDMTYNGGNVNRNIRKTKRLLEHIDINR